MKYQCTYCDISAKEKSDPKFDECKKKKHQIAAMLEKNEIKNLQSKANEKRRIQKKTKGWVGDRFVESIILDSRPCFLCYNKSTNGFECLGKIDTETYTVIPLAENEHGYLPYSFTESELDQIIRPDLSKEMILEEIKSLIDRFLSLNELDKHLILGDIMLTYCLEWINTLHFPFFVGETESGKSTALHLAKWLCYRCHLGEDIPMADVYNYLGSDEEGTGTIVEDEAQELWRSSEKLRMYKSSYSKGSKKARIVGVESLGKHQVFYNTFCPKWFAGEKIPQDKGFLERTAIVHMTEGRPISNIKRLTRDEVYQLNRLRNKLLVWKIQNIPVGLERIDSGLTQRDQELWEDYLCVVHGTKYYEPCKDVVANYVKQRHESIRNSLESTIFRSIIDIMDDEFTVKFIDVWTNIINSIPGHVDGNTFYPDHHHGKITFHTLNKMLEEKFHATRNQLRTSRDQITTYIFKKEVVAVLVRKYGIELPVSHILCDSSSGTHGTQSSVSDEPSVPSSETDITGEQNEL